MTPSRSMHVPRTQEQLYAELLERAPLASQARSSFVFPAVQVAPAPSPDSPPTTKNPLPVAGVRLAGAGGESLSKSCSRWDPEVFRPDGPVSCYSREIFFGESVLIPVSTKPGQGFKKPDCGKWVRKLKSGDRVRDIYHNCGALGCPVCMPGTLTDKARDVEARFDLYEQAKTAENAVLIPGEKPGLVPRQFIFTMSPSHMAELIAKVWRRAGKWDEGLFLEIAREEFNQALHYSGLIGGITVYHDARVRHPDTGRTGSEAKHLILMEAKSAGEMSDEDPAWKLYDYIRKQKKAWKYYYFSPHFHTIAFGKAIPIDEFENLMLGWTYHNKGDVKNPGGLARYLFSHMAMINDKKSCSWFGRLSSKTLGKTELRTYEQVEICEETGLPWIVHESVIPDEIGQEYRVSVTEWYGFFRKKQKRKPPNPDKLVFKTHGKRLSTPPGIHEKGVLAAAKYCDEFGVL